MAWAPAYTTLNEIKNYKRIDLTDTVDDAELIIAIEAASRAIDKSANRQFGKVNVAETREYTACFDGKRRHWIIEIDDLQDITGLTINAALEDDLLFDDLIDSFRLFPFNAVDKGKVFELVIVNRDSSTIPNRKEGGIQVEALFGWNTVPDTIKEATLVQADRFFTRRNAPFGVAGSPEIGSEVRLLSRIDPDVKVMVRTLTRWWGAV